MLTLLGLLSRLQGMRVQAKGGLGGECVDWANIYVSSVLGLMEVQRNAVDWARGDVDGLAWTANTPTNYPKPGDLAVWGPNSQVGTGPNGHIAVVLLADQMHLLTCDQNWPVGAPVGVVLHSYAGVLGWRSR